MQFRWQLAIYNQEGEKLIPLSEYLCSHDDGKADWIPDTDACSILLESRGREWIGLNWNFGDLDLMIFQFEAAWNRINSGQKAVIRSGIRGLDHLPYLLLDPSPGAMTFISLFIDESLIRQLFPINGINGSSEDLYKYVQENQVKLLSNRSDFREVEFPTRLLLESLEREALVGRSFFESIGMSLGD